MLQGWVILLVSFAYLFLLFGIAHWGDRRADAGRSLIANPYIYTLSIGVYCTSWTYYGSVGRAASSGIGFLPIYLGPTLTFAFGWFALRKILAISKSQNITSIADFIASRYGKSHLIAGLVTVIAVVGIMPYISLQLKAVATSFDVLVGSTMATTVGDTALYVALILAAFSILFGTRHIDATEHHEGMVAAIAFESLVKLVAFLAVGVFVTFHLYDGAGDLFAKAAQHPRIAALFHTDTVIASGNWVTLILLSMAAAICLPRQFQVTVVENVDSRHFAKAIWAFPLYLLAMNVFVLPITVAGLLLFPRGTDADTFVLALPMAAHHETLALLAFLGGLSAATGMVIVESIALSTMICNDLVMPVLLNMKWLRLAERPELGALLKNIRRVGIVLVLALGYTYFKVIGESFALVTIGLVSFAAAAQFAPAIFLGIYWKGGTRRGALAGLSSGFLLWGYTLLVPSFARSGWLDAGFVEHGLFGIALLKPQALLGIQGLDPLSHALFWSMLGNIGMLVAVSLFDRQSSLERTQATVFCEVWRATQDVHSGSGWRGSASVADLLALAERFVGHERAVEAFAQYGRSRGLNLGAVKRADAGTVQFTERLLGGAIGSASARVVVASVVKGEGVGMDEMLEILDEASHVIEYSRQLEQKSSELEQASADLRAANERLRELDRLKDEFLSTVTHELRTPLTSIRSFTEILHDNPDLDVTQRQEFLGIVIKESERLTRLINQVLDLARIESGRMQWHMAPIDMGAVLRDAINAMHGICAERAIHLDLSGVRPTRPVWGDHDRLQQVYINLLSNAAKFVPSEGGRIAVDLRDLGDVVRVSVTDNGPGIRREEQDIIFEKFRQAGSTTGNPGGTGLGLAICRRIVEHLGGSLWVESEPGEGSTFSFVVPVAGEADKAAREPADAHAV
ncbi:MAG: sensor histidine kinase [Alphaproteobacteria bacterium]